MSLLEKATIITTPTAHGNGTLHSIKGGAVADFDVVRGSAATRVNAEGLIEDISVLSEKITNGDFSNGSTNWNLENNWTIGNNAADGNGAVGSTEELTQNNAFTLGKTYKVVYEILNYISGTIQFQLAGGATLSGTTRSANGTYTEYVVATANHTLIKFKAAAPFNASITNISVIEITDATDIPRIDYTTGEGVVLLEPQSTNLITYSNELNQVGWFDSASVTITDDFGVSPDGTINASKWSNTASSFPQMGRTISGLTIGESYTASFYVKSDGTSQNQISTHFTGLSRVDFTPTSEWVRVTNTIVATATSHLFLLFINSGAAPASSFLIYGFQFEALSYPTSYIPTSGAIATRLADSVSGAGDATTFNDSEGVLYAEMAALVDSTTPIYISLSDGTTNNRISILLQDIRVRPFIRVGNVEQAGFSVSLGDNSIYHKIAFKYKENDFALWVNGVELGSDASGLTYSPNTLNKLSFDNGGGGSIFQGKVKALAVFNEALTDSELECLTTI